MYVFSECSRDQYAVKEDHECKLDGRKQDKGGLEAVWIGVLSVASDPRLFTDRRVVWEQSNTPLIHVIVRVGMIIWSD